MLAFVTVMIHCHHALQINHGVSVMLDDEMMNFARKAKANHIGCIVVASASKRLIANIQRLTLKGVHVSS